MHENGFELQFSAINFEHLLNPDSLDSLMTLAGNYLILLNRQIIFSIQQLAYFERYLSCLTRHELGLDRYCYFERTDFETRADLCVELSRLRVFNY